MQVAEYVSGRQRIVKHVGSAHTEAELGVLLETAREMLADPSQGVLDLALAPTPLVAPLVPRTGESALFGTSVAARGPGRDRPGRVVSTSSRVLFDALSAVFQDLVTSRIVEPTSLLDAGRVLTDLGRSSASYSTMKRTLRRARTSGYRDQVAAACFTHAATAGDISLCLYDVTTLYFEAEKEDDLRKVGYSKERRVDPKLLSVCWWTGMGSRWRSAASRATRPRRRP